jgi:hypothetical protein
MSVANPQFMKNIQKYLYELRSTPTNFSYEPPLMQCESFR